jgi:hypothetical protein
MVTNMLKAHLDFNKLINSSGETYSPRSMALMTRAIFFTFAILLFPQNTFAKKQFQLKIAVLDTGFCPGLLSTHPKITVESVADVTQSNNYKCNESTLKGMRFHGQDVLEVFIHNYPSNKETPTLLVTPVVIFNKNALQKVSYWNQALELVKEHDIIISATGLPLPRDPTQAKNLLKKAKLPRPLTILASGRIAPGIDKKTKLFPQEFYFQENIVLLGSYYQPLFESSLAQRDEGLLYQKEISLLFPSSGKKIPKLKGASRALASGSAKLISRCGVFIKKSSLSLFQKCIEKSAKSLKFKKPINSMKSSKTLF